MVGLHKLLRGFEPWQFIVNITTAIEKFDVHIVWVDLKGKMCLDFKLIRRTNAPWY